jgi:hypothetical protein
MTDIEHGELSLKELAEFMRDTREALDKAKEKVAKIQKLYDGLRKRDIPNKMEEMGIDNVKITGLGRLGLRAEAYAGFQPGKKEEGIAWLEEHGHGDLVKEDVNASTLKAFLKEQFRNGEVLPDDMFKLEPYMMATITKS